MPTVGLWPSGKTNFGKVTWPGSQNGLRRFRDQCQALIRDQVELTAARAIVALGTSVPPFLAAFDASLAAWKPWTSFARLDARGDVANGGARFRGNP